jgi:hypothetical protein
MEHTYLHPALAATLSSRPLLRQRAWHCLAFRQGHAHVEHIDLNDDLHQFTIIFVLGNFTGGDLILPQLRIRIPLKPGQILFLRTRYVVHYASDYQGIRYIFSGFMDSTLCNDYRKSLAKDKAKA